MQPTRCRLLAGQHDRLTVQAKTVVRVIPLGKGETEVVPPSAGGQFAVTLQRKKQTPVRIGRNPALERNRVARHVAGQFHAPGPPLDFAPRQTRRLYGAVQVKTEPHPEQHRTPIEQQAEPAVVITAE